MKNKNILLLVLLFLVCILSISAISATANEDAISTDNNDKNSVETINQHDDVSTSEENYEISTQENKNDKQDKSVTDKTTTDNDEPLGFTELNKTINNNTDDEINLYNNYTFFSIADSDFEDGISIDRNLTINGNGFTINGGYLARAFNVNNTLDLTVKFNNINFINCYNKEPGGAIKGGDAYSCNFTYCISDAYGGAIYQGDAFECIFNDNNATNGGAICNGTAIGCKFNNNNASYGGALYDVNAIDCVFRGNSASEGQAMMRGNAVLCIFNGDSTYQTNVIPVNISAINYTSTYRSDEKFYFYIIANGTYYSGINATIAISKIDGSFVKNVTALSSDQLFTEGGWVVDLEPGEYTASLTLPNYPEETATATASINVSKVAPTLFIDPINDTEVGNEIIINYTTNSTGTVTIRVNGTTLTEDRKFTPNQAGIYNVTIEVAEDQYYLAATNETTFTVSGGSEKINTTVKIIPIDHAHVGEELTINYDTNSNGTVTIKVNGTPITDGKFTPDKAGIYNVTIEVAENDYYTAAYNETTFTVEKQNATISIAPITDVVVGQEVTIVYNTTSNGTVTIKVNGQEITNNTYTPESKGTYQVTIDVAENDYYNALHGEITFEANKIDPIALITPISDAYVGQEITIGHYTNSNGTVTIKVNGTTLSEDYKFTPDKAGIYNVTIEVAENDYYNAAYNETTFTVEKQNPTIIIGQITHAQVGDEVEITYNTTSDGAVTIKVNGAPITGTKYTPATNGTYYVTVEVAETDKYNAASEEITFYVGKVNATLVIANITNAHVGEELTIEYATNSNGTVTIKVNGTPITDRKFTPDKEGIYNVTIEIADNDYFYAVSNETTFTVGKIDPTVIITNITDVFVGKEITIGYNTNSNGTVTIKVNGTPITDGKFTPDKEGIYNVTVEVAANEYYNAASNETTFTVEKQNATIIISPIVDVFVGEEVTIAYNTTSDGKVTIKVNGQEIEGDKYTPDNEGTYTVTVEVEATDKFNAASSEINFTVKKMDPIVIITPITDVVVGQEVTITYNTDSNGTVTIKVNGQVITNNTFTPTTSGSYIVTVEVAANDYYNAASNETTFTVEKQNATLVINPIDHVLVGEEVTITYSTNSNGTVTIKVNGTPIADNKFTPEEDGIYNVTIEIAENDYYNAVSNETTFKVGRMDPIVIITPISNVVVGQQVTIAYSTDSNGTVTIKVNGQAIKGNKFTPTANGTYTVTVEVAENDYYNAASNETTFNVQKIATKIIGRDVTTTYNAVKELVITLKDANGIPLKKQVLSVKILGKTQDYVTDSNGQIKIKVPTSAPKSYQVNVKYAGSDKYKVSSGSVKVVVKKATPKITANAAKYKAKTLTKKYTITLKNQNKAVPNKKVALKVNGKTYTSKTNSKGQATFKITKLNKKGVYKATITATADHYYYQATKNVKIIVQK